MIYLGLPACLARFHALQPTKKISESSLVIGVISGYWWGSKMTALYLEWTAQSSAIDWPH